MSGMPWFKVWNEMPLDAKWDSISSEFQWNKMSLIGFWATLLCFASASPERGKLLVTRTLRVTNEFLAKFFDIELYQADELIAAFIQAELLEEGESGILSIKKWEERQKSPDPTAAERNSRARAKKKAAVTRNVTRNEHDLLRVEDRGQRIDSIARDSFESMRDMVISLTGLQVVSGADLQAVREWAEMGITENDIRGALQWRSENKKPPIKTVSQLIGGVQTERNKRIQGGNSQYSEPDPVTYASEVY